MDQNAVEEFGYHKGKKEGEKDEKEYFKEAIKEYCFAEEQGEKMKLIKKN